MCNCCLQCSRVLYHQLVLTAKEYMREVTALDPKMARGIFTEILPICRPNPTHQKEETTEDRALVQQI